MGTFIIKYKLCILIFIIYKITKLRMFPKLYTFFFFLFSVLHYSLAQPFLPLTWAVEPQFDKVEPFIYGIAYVEKGKDKFCINYKGEKLLYSKVDYDKLKPKKNNQEIGYNINQKEATEIFNYSDGYWRIKSENGNYGFANEHRIVRFAIFKDAKDCSEGLAAVKMNKKWGYSEPSAENYTIGYQYDDAQPFSEGFAWVKLNNAWQLIDKENQSYLNDSAIQEAMPVSAGVIAVKKGDKWGFVFSPNPPIDMGIYSWVKVVPLPLSILAPKEKRIALIIAINDYTNFDKIPSAALDGKCVKDSLLLYGFKKEDIIYIDDTKATKREIESAINTFKEKVTTLSDQDAAIFYYSGHGFYTQGEDNEYIIPKNANKILSTTEITRSVLNTKYVSLESLNYTLRYQSKSANFFMYDACKNTVFIPTKEELVAKGVANKTSPIPKKNVFIKVYASKGLANGAATGNSVFTKNLLQKIGLDLSFKEILDKAVKATKYQGQDSRLETNGGGDEFKLKPFPIGAKKVKIKQETRKICKNCGQKPINARQKPFIHNKDNTITLPKETDITIVAQTAFKTTLDLKCAGAVSSDYWYYVKNNESKPVWVFGTYLCPIKK